MRNLHGIDPNSQAVSVASAISDRLCIESNGFFQGLISSQQLLSCTKGTFGCRGGWPQLAWKHWGHEGVVTGGDYESNQVSRAGFQQCPDWWNKTHCSYTEISLVLADMSLVSHNLDRMIKIVCFRMISKNVASR